MLTVDRKSKSGLKMHNMCTHCKRLYEYLQRQLKNPVCMILQYITWVNQDLAMSYKPLHDLFMILQDYSKIRHNLVKILHKILLLLGMHTHKQTKCLTIHG